MVNRFARRGMWVAVLILALVPVLPGVQAQEENPVQSVNQALGKTASRWYDPVQGTVRPVEIPIDRVVTPSSSDTSLPSLPRVGGVGPGNILPIVVLSIGLVLLVSVLVWYWNEYKPTADTLPAEKPRGPGKARQIEELPAALRGASDPWQEALRLRDRGELGPAVVQLFAHQLLTLSRLELVRLAPGRTGRQLVKAVTDAELRNLTTPTLRAFESFYYGHHAPTESEFAALWRSAETFERRASGVGVAS